MKKSDDSGDTRFSCPKCGQRYEAPREMSGSVLNCQACGQSVRIVEYPSVRPIPPPLPPSLESSTTTAAPSPPALPSDSQPGVNAVRVAEGVLRLSAPLERSFAEIEQQLIALGGTTKTANVAKGYLETGWKYGPAFRGHPLRVCAHLSPLPDDATQVVFTGRFSDAFDTFGVARKKALDITDAFLMRCPAPDAQSMPSSASMQTSSPPSLPPPEAPKDIDYAIQLPPRHCRSRRKVQILLDGVVLGDGTPCDGFVFKGRTSIGQHTLSIAGSIWTVASSPSHVLTFDEPGSYHVLLFWSKWEGCFDFAHVRRITSMTTITAEDIAATERVIKKQRRKEAGHATGRRAKRMIVGGICTAAGTALTCTGVGAILGLPLLFVGLGLFHGALFGHRVVTKREALKTE